MNRDERTQAAAAEADAGATVPESDATVAAAGSAETNAALTSIAEAEDRVPEDWTVGETLLELYDVSALLGEGGMGKVYRIRHRGWGVDLAVKTPRPEVLRQAGGKENFIREAETWVGLGLHPHIVSCYYVRTLGGIPRVFAEYVEGGSLADWIRTRRLYEGGPQQALERILDIAIQAAWGLHYAHEQRLVHQDVKPANLLLTPSGTVKVTDFGLAKARPAGAAGEGNVLVSAAGMTPAYCSPEQAAGEPLTRASDAWSWALSVLEMFSGGVGWLAGQAAPEALQAYLHSRPGDAGIPAMPEAVARLLWQCFRWDPAQRPAKLLEAADTLQSTYAQLLGKGYGRSLPKGGRDTAASLNNRAASLRDLGRDEEALQLWERALEFEPHHPESTYNHGLSLWRLSRITDQRLVTRLEEVRRSHQAEWMDDYLTALVHLERGDCDAALHSLGEIPEPASGRQEVLAALRAARERLPHSSRLLRTSKDHKHWVYAVALSRDGLKAVSGSEDNTVKLWDATTGRCVRTCLGLGAGVFNPSQVYVTQGSAAQAVSLSPDAQFALSGGEDKLVKLWELSTARCLRIFQGHEARVVAVCLSPNLRVAISGGEDRTIRMWDVVSGKHLATACAHDGLVTSLCLSADAGFLLSGGSDRVVKLWNIHDGSCVRLEGHRAPVNSVCLSPDARYALSGASDAMVKLWETGTGACLRTLEAPEGVYSVWLGSDPRYVLSAGGDTLRLWDTRTGRCLRTFTGHTGQVTAIAASEDGKTAVSCGHDWTVRFWSIMGCVAHAYAAPIALSRVQESEQVLSSDSLYRGALAEAHVAIERGDLRAAAAQVEKAREQPGFNRHFDAMQVWSRLYLVLPRKSLRGGWETSEIHAHQGGVTSLCVSQDGRHVLTGSYDQTAKLWEAATGACLRTFVGHGSWVNAVCLSQDGKYALSGSSDNTLKWWELETGQCVRTCTGQNKTIGSVCLTRDGLYACSASGAELALWEIATGRLLRTYKGHQEFVRSVSVSPNGHYLVSGSQDKTVMSWDLASGRRLYTFRGHGSWVMSVCLSQDQRFILSGGGCDYQMPGMESENALRLWEPGTGQCVAVMAGHAKSVTSVSLSWDGRFAVSGSEDGTLRIWDVSARNCLLTFQGHIGGILSAGLAPDLRYAVSGGRDGTVRIWALDWDLDVNCPRTEWDERARPLLEVFLTFRTPYGGLLPSRGAPTGSEVKAALTHRGEPVWDEDDFRQLMLQLQYAGYGRLSPETVRGKLREITAERAGWSGRLLRLVRR